jgi:hypothetical protein
MKKTDKKIYEIVKIDGVRMLDMGKLNVKQKKFFSRGHESHAFILTFNDMGKETTDFFIRTSGTKTVKPAKSQANFLIVHMNDYKKSENVNN